MSKHSIVISQVSKTTNIGTKENINGVNFGAIYL